MPKKKTRRILSGLEAPGKKRKKKSKKSAGGWKRVPRSAATHSSGKKKGRLKKGCKFTKGGAMCRGTSGGTKKRRKKSGSKKSGTKLHLYSAGSSLPFKKGKGGKKVLKKTCRRVTEGANRGKIACRRKMTRRAA
ncbi:MAG TPA: hypothetical protein PKD27_02455 [Tepidiformaceae bacterium]|nr:hypothetical protein [Tepidiformaceae bacterium]